MPLIRLSIGSSAPDRGLDVADGRSLPLADVLPALTVGGRDPLRQAEHEAPVVVQLLRRGLALEQLDGLSQLTEAVLPQLVEGAVAGAVPLRLCRDPLVEQLALAVLLSRLGVCLRHREALAYRAAALGHEDKHPGGGRSLEDELPLLLAEIGFPRHAVAPSGSGGFSTRARERSLEMRVAAAVRGGAGVRANGRGRAPTGTGTGRKAGGGGPKGGPKASGGSNGVRRAAATG